ncbi:MAG: DUF374 domain-containing protein [Candidatus Sabulitectum sp.]|nr:DUF374 domain-containing protein [Candidatus Sabulitectum sp.]
MKAETAGTAGRIILNLLGRTWRVSRYRPSTGIWSKTALYALWHNAQLPLIYTHRKMNIRLLISRSSDGELVSEMCERMGFQTVRGSSSKGGTSAARELVNLLAGGSSVAITPDGPRGPANMVKKGISLIPRRANIPVIPYGVSAFPTIRLKSWDRFMIPLPFARLVISEGKPVMPRHCNRETLTAAIKAESSRAALGASPMASLMISVIKATARILTPLTELVLLFRSKAERKERKGFVPVSSTRPVWLHGSSLGELKGLLPIIESIRAGGSHVFVTCSTVAAREFITVEDLNGAFQPLDTPGAVSRFLDRLQPSALILTETEFWPVLLHETVSRGITAGMVNARLSRKSVRGYGLIKPLFSKTLSCFRGILTRSQEDTDRFRELNVKTEPAGDGKTAVKPVKPDPAWKAKIAAGTGGILVAGSTRKGEEATILEIAGRTGLTPVLVPRHENRIGEVVQTAINAGFKPDLWTDDPIGSSCLIVNVKGVLASLYGLADIAFVGGTLVPLGGHNILEPLAHGIPVIVGPHYHHFTDVVKQAAQHDICRVFADSEEGTGAVEYLLSQERELHPESTVLQMGRDAFLSKLKTLLQKMEINNEI